MTCQIQTTWKSDVEGKRREGIGGKEKSSAKEKTIGDRLRRKVSAQVGRATNEKEEKALRRQSERAH